eukprot:COSAG05_NODE_467_length_9529_cov_27.560976_4_plen_54_part_00
MLFLLASRVGIKHFAPKFRIMFGWAGPPWRLFLVIFFVPLSNLSTLNSFFDYG